MKTFRLLCWFLCGLFFGGYSAYSFANTTALDYWVAGASGPQATYAAACQAVMASGDTYFGVTACGGSYPNRSCHCAKTVTGGGADTGIVVSEYVFCPAGNTLDSSHGTPYQCIPSNHCASKPDTVISSGLLDMGTANPAGGGSSNFCGSDGCTTFFVGSGPCPAYTGKGADGLTHYICQGEIHQGNTECTGGNPPPTPTTPDEPKTPSDCTAKGQSWGMVNGVVTCVPAGTRGTPPVTENKAPTTDTKTSDTGGTNCTPSTSTSSSTDADGVVSNTTTTMTADCKVTTTVSHSGSEVTANGDGTVTVKNSGTDANGKPVTDTKTVPQDDYCNTHPADAVCKKPSDNSASGGGDCTAPPTCSGDAIQCAMLAQQWHTRCDMQNDAKNDPSFTLGQQIGSGNDPLASHFPTPEGGVQVDVSNELKTDEVFAAACPPPVSFSVQGKTFTLSYDPICQFGAILGTINVIMATIGAAYILGRT